MPPTPVTCPKCVSYGPKTWLKMPGEKFGAKGILCGRKN